VLIASTFSDTNVRIDWYTNRRILVGRTKRNKAEGITPAVLSCIGQTPPWGHERVVIYRRSSRPIGEEWETDEWVNCFELLGWFRLQSGPMTGHDPACLVDGVRNPSATKRHWAHAQIKVQMVSTPIFSDLKRSYQFILMCVSAYCASLWLKRWHFHELFFSLNLKFIRFW
jgi:hypothetical protein